MSDLLKFKAMAEQNKNIRATPHLVEVKTAKGGGHLTFGIDQATTQDLVLNPDKFLVVAYIVDREEFKAIQF